MLGHSSVSPFCIADQITWAIFGGVGQGAGEPPIGAESGGLGLGTIVFLVALSAIGRMEARQEYINMVLVAWIFVAPWALGFTPLGRASWDHWIVGPLIFLISLWSLSMARPEPIATTTASPVNRPPRDRLTR